MAPGQELSMREHIRKIFKVTENLIFSEVNMSDIYSVRRFQNSDADEVSELIIKTLRTTNMKEYSVEYIENDVKMFTPS